MRTRDAHIIIVPGLGDSGPDHWQSRWQAKLPTAQRVAMSSWSAPLAAEWTSTVSAAIAADTRPVVIVAHSLGVIAVARALVEPGTAKVAGAYLVAPPAEETVRGHPDIDPAFLPFPRTTLPCPAVVVGSRNDPYDPLGFAATLARDWGSTFIDAGEAGHLNGESGHGPWPEGLMAFAGFLNKL
jgi:predicted alpha/beta hydrolase family esterase